MFDNNSDKHLFILGTTFFEFYQNLQSCKLKMYVCTQSSNFSKHNICCPFYVHLGRRVSLLKGKFSYKDPVHVKFSRLRDDAWFAALGRSCIHMTWSDRGLISLEGLDLEVVQNVEDAEFILAHGSEALGHPSGAACPMKLEELESILERCAAKNIPMVVANPDFVTVEARALLVMPGTLAAKYEELGGEVKWMGKPDKIIYKSAMAMAGVDAASDSIAVGDSLHHDIKGANAAGIQAVFITGGIHATELGLIINY
ncbi:hypothetical protein UlMin_028896 [Ulmus minor]